MKPTSNEDRAMAWWNDMTEAQRIEVMLAGRDALGFGPSVAEVWNLCVAGKIAGPPVPQGAGPIDHNEAEKRSGA